MPRAATRAASARLIPRPGRSARMRTARASIATPAAKRTLRSRSRAIGSLRRRAEVVAHLFPESFDAVDAAVARGRHDDGSGQGRFGGFDGRLQARGGGLCPGEEA